MAVAYRSGRMDMLSPDSKEPALALDMPASKSIQLGVVDKLLAGPASTLLVGGRSGFVGVWDTGSGKLLEHAWLHGAPLYMTVVADKLYAASEVGDFEVIDLAIYGRDYCDLMREVWAEAPIVWQAGKPLVAAPDPGHRCAQGR